jgi:protein MpaA
MRSLSPAIAPLSGTAAAAKRLPLLLTSLLMLGAAFWAHAVHAAPLEAVSQNSVDTPAGWCQRISERLPGVSKTECRASALVPTGARSHNGFPILIRRFVASSERKMASSAGLVSASMAGAGLAGGTTSGANAAPLRILLLGGIHGDELTASAIVFEWMQSIQGGPAEKFHWEVVPVLNPDGLLAAQPSRVNAQGVDLNRNFPTLNWEVEAPRYWARQTGSDPRRYPGKSALSEPETRWLNEELLRFRPQLIVSVHAPFGVLDFDGPTPPPQRFGRLALNPVGVYPGSLGNYAGALGNVPVITIELPHAFVMPSDTETQKIWSDMLAWIERNVGASRPASQPQDTKPAPRSLSASAGTALLNR